MRFNRFGTAVSPIGVSDSWIKIEVRQQRNQLHLCGHTLQIHWNKIYDWNMEMTSPSTKCEMRRPYNFAPRMTDAFWLCRSEWTLIWAVTFVASSANAWCLCGLTAMCQISNQRTNTSRTSPWTCTQPQAVHPSIFFHFLFEFFRCICVSVVTSPHHSPRLCRIIVEHFGGNT